MKICPRCKFQNPDAVRDCLACGINIRWAILNPSKCGEIVLDPDRYEIAVARRSQLRQKKQDGQPFSLRQILTKLVDTALLYDTNCIEQGEEEKKLVPNPTPDSEPLVNDIHNIRRKKILFRNGSSITLSQNEKIEITRKTISFGRDVYQSHNVVGFSDGEVDLGKIIPMWIVLTGFLVGFVVGKFEPWVGILIGWLSFVALIINIAQKKKYGFLLTLTSGDKHLFITSDSRGLAEVVDQIRRFMESDENTSYTVAVNNNSITVHGNFTGVAASGNNASTISNNL
jgi:hypothetical protein